MKRLVAVVMMIATGVFMAVTMASAADLGNLNGVYGMAATGTCLHDKSPADTVGGGFTFSGTGTLGDPYTATPKSDDHFVSTYMGHGAWWFDGQGHGSMWAVQYCVLPPYTGSLKTKVTQSLQPSAPLPAAMTQVPFTYTVDGYLVTVTIPPPVKLTLYGWLSTDHRTMTLQSAMPLPEQGIQYNGVIGYWQICTIARTLNRIIE
jgi:hypothetical protein